MVDNIKGKAFSSIIWTILQKVFGLSIQFISGIILARLLSPDDYGAIGMLIIFTSISNVFVDGGFGAALIQKQNVSQTDYSTVFYWNLGISVVLYLVLYFLAPYIALFYKMPILSSVLRFQSSIIIISAFSNIQLNILKKELRFKEVSIISLLSSIVALIITIILASFGYGVWALVAQYILMAFIPTVSYWFICKWTPNLTFSISSFKGLFKFGCFVLLSNLINNIGRSLEGLLIGRFYNASTMGLYTKGKSLEGIAMTGITDALSQVTFPLYSGFQDNISELRNIIRKLTKMTAFVIFPFAFFLIIIANPLFSILYSNKWLGSVPYFQVLTLSGIAVALQGVNGQIINAIGLSKKQMDYTIYKRILNIILLLIGLYYFGMKGLLSAVVLESWISYSINALLVSKHIGYSLKQQITDILEISLLSILLFIIIYLIQYTVGGNFYFVPLIAGGLYITVYLFLSYIFKISSLFDIIRILKNNFNKYHSNE